MFADPFDGLEKIVKYVPSVSPSGSVALMSPLALPSSVSVALKSPDRMVKSLTEETIREIDWVDELLKSSVMETENESDPKKFGCGVYDHDPVS